MLNLENDARLYPLLGYAAGVIDSAVALRLDFATTRAGYAAGCSESQQYVMTADAAIDIGRALIQRGEFLRAGARH